jgi:hypothetical protein
MVKNYNVQNEQKKNLENEGPWVVKSTPFIVCDIFLERYCTAGILGECNKDKWFFFKKISV